LYKLVSIELVNIEYYYIQSPSWQRWTITTHTWNVH